MKLCIGAASHVGDVRDRNEDAFLVGRELRTGGCLFAEVSASAPVFARCGLLAAVADGMGGHRGGGVASRLALETLAHEIHAAGQPGDSLDERARHVERCLLRANDALCEAGRKNEELADAGTTVVGVLVFSGGDAVLFHAGDSRAFRTSAGLTRALTVDHTLVARRIAVGDAAEEEALRDPQARCLTNAMGRGLFTPEITTRFGFGPGDRLLLASDGVSAYGGGLGEAPLRELLGLERPAVEIAPLIIDAARRADGSDNLTAVVIDFVADGARASDPRAPADALVSPAGLGTMPAQSDDYHDG